MCVNRVHVLISTERIIFKNAVSEQSGHNQIIRNLRLYRSCVDILPSKRNVQNVQQQMYTFVYKISTMRLL